MKRLSVSCALAALPSGLLWLKYLLLLLVCLSFCRVMQAEQVGNQDKALKDAMNRPYWLYTPKSIDPKKTYWLVVGVHGHNGKGAGAAGLKSWVEKYDDVIVVDPQFPDNGPYYQVLGGASDTQLINLHADLSKKFKLHPKMFIYGFSGGAQYAHRFANHHPDYVIGVSANSGGTWDAGPSNKAKFPWVISCGINDTQVSAGASAPRIDCFRAFYKVMNKGTFTVKPFVTEASHRAAPAVGQATEECFRVSTTGLFDYQREAVRDMTPKDREAWLLKDTAVQEKEFNDGKNVYKLKVNKDAWTVDAITLENMKNTRLFLDKEKES